MKKLWILASLMVIALAGCSGGSDTASGGTDADNAAANSANSPDAVPIDPNLRQDAPNANVNTGSGNSGIRSVPPTSAGDRN